MNNYPNPCDSCTGCIKSTGCERWRIRFLTIWKQFNAYPKRQSRKKIATLNKFRYEHPDMLRRYLSKSPCEGCEYEVLCDVPCWKYMNWYDARMAWMKERFGQ